MEDASEYHPCNCNNGFLLAPSFCDALIFDGKIRLLFALYSSKVTLDQQRVQVLSGFGTPGRFPFAGVLMISRGKLSDSKTDISALISERMNSADSSVISGTEEIHLIFASYRRLRRKSSALISSLDPLMKSM